MSRTDKDGQGRTTDDNGRRTTTWYNYEVGHWLVTFRTLLPAPRIGCGSVLNGGVKVVDYRLFIINYQ